MITCTCINLELEISTIEPVIELELSMPGIMPPEYDGPYVVIPNTYDQVLDTQDKMLTENVVVKEVPYAEVANEYGTTVTIIS